MSQFGLPIIDDSVHSANAWLNRLTELTGWDHKQRAYRLLRATLHALRDHLGVNEAADLGAQLPTLIRGIYYEGFHPAQMPVKDRSREHFLARIEEAFETDPMGDAPEAVGAVLTLLSEHVSPGEMDDIRVSFAKEIRALFP